MTQTELVPSTRSPHPKVEEAGGQLASALHEIQQLCASTDASTLFTATAVLLGDPESRLPADVQQLIPAKLQLLLYVASESFGTSRECIITEDHLAKCVRDLDAAYVALRTILCGQFLADAAGFDTKSFMLSSLAIETSMGVGSAEIEQTMSLLKLGPGRFDGWFDRRLGITPTRVIEALESIAKVQVSTSRERVLRHAVSVWRRCCRDGHDSEDLSSFLKLGQGPFLSSVELAVMPVALSEVREFCPMTDAEWSALLSLIGCSRSSRQGMNHPLDVHRHPLAVLSGDKVFLINLPSCLHQAFERFDSAAKSEPDFASGKYQKQISSFVEANAASHFERLFPPNAVFRNLVYPDPDRNDGSSAELDIAVAWPPFLIICEAKSKQLRFDPIRVDIGRFCSDVKANIEDSFEQASRFLRYVEKVDDILLTEKGAGRQLSLPKADIRQMFIISVSLRRLLSVAGQLRTLRKMGLFKNGQFPWAVGLDDLDLITWFCPGPDVFLHFVQRRLSLEQEPVPYAGSELDFFGCYLNSGRLEPRIWEYREKVPQLITMTDYHQRFRNALQQLRLGIPVSSPIPLCVPATISAILKELAGREQDAQARWIAFSVLSLTDDQLAALSYTFEALRASASSAGRIRSTALKWNDVVFSLTLSEEDDLKQLYEITLDRAISEKYRTKADRCVALGLEYRNQARPFAHAFWLEDKWKPDPNLEEHVRQMETRKSVMLPPGSKMPGRNERCPCGSGKKFKHCCLGKLS